MKGAALYIRVSTPISISKRQLYEFAVSRDEGASRLFTAARKMAAAQYLAQVATLPTVRMQL